MSPPSFVETVTTRHNELIDPTMHIWGWEIPVYLFLGGLAAGLLVLPALLEMLRGERTLPLSVKLMPFAGLALITLGMVALFLDLEYKSHVWRFFLALKPASPMSWGSWILVIVYPIGVLLGLSMLSARESAVLEDIPLLSARIVRSVAAFCDRRRRTILWWSIAAGLALGTYTGLLLGTLSARPMWSTTILGPLFLVSGLSTGAAFMMLFRPGGFVHHKLAGWDMALIIVELVFIALFLITLSNGSQTSQQAARDLLGGRWTAAFWSLVVFLGLLVPLALERLERKHQATPALITSILVLAGGLSLRWILLVAGQATSFASIN